MTALDLITRSLRLLNVIGEGETPSGPMSDAAFDDLTDLMDWFKLRRLTVRQVVRSVFTLSSGVGTYTIGPGATFNVAVPLSLEGAAILTSLTSDEEIPVDVLTDQAYREYSNKGASSTLPADGVYLDKSFSTSTGRSNIVVLPKPSVANRRLVLYMATPLSIFADLSTNYLLPTGHARMLRYQLARELKDRYPGTWTAELEKTAAEVFGAVMRVNDVPAVLRVDPMLSVGGGVHGFDINRGWI